MEQIRSGEILFKANLRKQEEKRKLKKLKKEQSLLQKIGKLEVRTYYLYLLYFPEFVYMRDKLPMFHYASC